jgi:CDP-diglyceride synthetase
MLFVELLYFFLPGYVANGAPPVVAKLPLLRRWNTPVDLRASWKGKRLLGDNKTVRGVVTGILLSGLVFLLQKYFLSSVVTTLAIPYDSLPWWFGFLLGFGVLVVGDCGKSFLKRRLGFAPGKSWVPFDQVDYTIGAFLATAWLFWPGWPGLLFLLVANALITASFHAAGHLLRVNATWF